MKTVLLCSLSFVVCTLFTVSASAQVVVDATAPSHRRVRNPTSGHSGSIGRKLPLQVKVEFRGPAPDGNNKGIVEFILTNIGDTELAIPVSPNPGDFEPSDGHSSYTLQSVALRINSIRPQKAEMLSGGADLYGSRDLPGTLAPLAPGESIRVLAQVALPPLVISDETRRTVFVAYAALNDETITTLHGQTFSDTSEIGSANSQEYNIHTLFGVPK